MSQFDFVILSIATWRLAYMLVSETGPMNLFVKLRERLHGGLFDCIYCCSVWVAMIWLALWYYGAIEVAYPFAISGAAMMLRAFTGAGLHDV